jgi:hypothetical protein
MKINRRRFFSNLLALSAVTCLKPLNVAAPTGFISMSGTSMEIPQMSGMLAMAVSLKRNDLVREIIHDLQRRTGTEIKIEKGSRQRNM